MEQSARCRFYSIQTLTKYRNAYFPMNPQIVLKNLERRNSERKAGCLELWKRACMDFEEIKNRIICNYAPTRIYQWGSLLHPELFNENSDIDIGIEGLVGGGTLFHLYDDVEKLTQFSLDIVEVDKILPEFADIIKMKSRIVYER